MTQVDPLAPRRTATRLPPAARPPRTVPGFLAWRAALQPDHVAFEVSGGPTLTLAEWDAGASRVAAALRARGVRAGDRVALVFAAADWPWFAIAYCGVQRAGGVAVPLSDRLPAVQIGYALEQCAAVAVLHGGDTAPAGVPATAWTAPVPSLTAPSTDLEGAAEIRPGDLAQILYTSGTTGRPKGVTATHANLSMPAPVHPRRLRLAHSARFAHAFPIGTNAAQTMLFHALYARPGAVSLARVTPARFARLIETPGVGTVFLVPSVAIELLDSGALDGRDTSGIHLVGSTAAPLAPAIAMRLSRAFPHAAIVNYYTSTEAAPSEVSMVFDPARPDAIGRPADGTLMIADGDGNPLPAGTTGEVWLRSPHPRAYYADPDASAAAFRGEWVRMGDLGRLDAGGYLHLAGRGEDVVKTGAFKVSTVEVEAALHEHPHVAEVAVLGVPHNVLGCVLGAVVVPSPAAPAGEPTLPAVRRFLATRLADYQIPAHLAVRDSLPRNAGGKVLKRQLAGVFPGVTASGGQGSEGAP
ncbi:class I adenylate-forming enzyme family protein [Phytohabitans aurantiacus]|uniref:Acyl-CoA synthetase n=1 Tax=Phytohabitans aurantiacus TaxID=3016789 RepID=A0ABQ5QU91_9ACTN|nr:AMP-binding protein [Phytohabitans aurantiacus]GLH98153.1 acyl-CoA synthetase [Phytohabitans aurantiacus]